MNTNSKSVMAIITTLSAGVFAVGVQFKNEKGEGFGTVYTYKTKAEVKEGDEVIVDSPFTGMTVAVVVSVQDILEIDVDVSFNYKWIVDVIDKEAWEEVKAKEDEFEKEINALQSKVKKVKMIEELRKAIGVDDCDELDALIAKVTK